MRKEGSHFIFLPAILIDSVYKMSKSYYTQVFFRKMQIHCQKRDTISRSISDVLDISFGSFDKEMSDEEGPDEGENT